MNTGSFDVGNNFAVNRTNQELEISPSLSKISRTLTNTKIAFFPQPQQGSDLAFFMWLISKAFKTGTSKRNNCSFYFVCHFLTEFLQCPIYLKQIS